MSVLDKLIRFHKFDLDEKRRALRGLEEQEASVQKAIYNLEQEIQAEQSFSRSQSDLAPYYGGYANRSKTRRDTLEADCATLTQQLSASNQQLSLVSSRLRASVGRVGTPKVAPRRGSIHTSRQN